MTTWAGAVAVLLALSMLPAGPAHGQDRYAEARERMVRSQIEARGVRDRRVLAAMGAVPRHRFVPGAYSGEAYDDHPLPIGLGQTISQPYIVAFMTELLALGPDDRVFELGTGSGYQAAVASKVAGEVYTVEIYAQLARAAAERLKVLGFDRVHARQGDGYHGWPEAAPFDAIIVTAAADHIPPPLIDQLAPGGRLVIPLGNPFTVQQLVLATKDRTGKVTTEPVIPVRFVPLLGH